MIDDLGCATYLSSTDDVSDHVVPVSSHHTQQVSPTCPCIDVLHICFLQSTSVTKLGVESELVLSICDSDNICILSFSVPFELWLLELLMSVQLQLVRPAATCHFSCQLSCNISAQLHPVSSDETCHLNCNVLAEL